MTFMQCEPVRAEREAREARQLHAKYDQEEEFRMSQKELQELSKKQEEVEAERQRVDEQIRETRQRLEGLECLNWKQ